MAYNPNILQKALQVRRLTSAQLSKRLGIDPTEFNRDLHRDPEPKQDLLRMLARELAIPPFAFYMEHLPELEEAMPDFRSPKPEIGAKVPGNDRSHQAGRGHSEVAYRARSTGRDRLAQVHC